MRVTFKPGAQVVELSPALWWMWGVLLRLPEEVAGVNEMVITSVNDSKHTPKSRHYTNEAFDLRTKHIRTKARKLAVRDWLAKALGAEFTVLFEAEGTANEHLHLQVRKGHTFAGIPFAAS